MDDVRELAKRVRALSWVPADAPLPEQRELLRLAPALGKAVLDLSAEVERLRRLRKALEAENG